MMIEAQEALASVALAKGEADLLNQTSEQIIRLRPDLPSGYVLRAAARFSRKDVPGGEADLKKAIEIAPQSPVGYSRLGGLRLAEKRYSEAEKLYEQGLERDPNFAEALQGLLNLFLAQKQAAKALARLNQQIAKSPNNSSFYLMLARFLLSNGDAEQAEAAAQKAVDLTPNHGDALLTLGQAQATGGSPDKAIATYMRVIQENPRDVRPLLLVAQVQESQGDWRKAQQAYEKALQIQPDNPLAANNLAYLMLEHDLNTDVALFLAQTGRRGLPDSPSAADTLGWAYYQKGTYQSAADLLEEAAKKSSKDANIFYHLGLAYRKLGDGARAKAQFERVLQLAPNPHAAEIRLILAELNRTGRS
jgi:tetratricopeptide (TPR) repeat protein